MLDCLSKLHLPRRQASANPLWKGSTDTRSRAETREDGSVSNHWTTASQRHPFRSAPSRVSSIMDDGGSIQERWGEGKRNPPDMAQFRRSAANCGHYKRLRQNRRASLSARLLHCFQEEVAGVTGLEPATFGVTGRHSNQLSYTPAGPYRTARCLVGSAAFRVGER